MRRPGKRFPGRRRFWRPVPVGTLGLRGERRPDRCGGDRRAASTRCREDASSCRCQCVPPPLSGRSSRNAGRILTQGDPRERRQTIAWGEGRALAYKVSAGRPRQSMVRPRCRHLGRSIRHSSRTTTGGPTGMFLSRQQRPVAPARPLKRERTRHRARRRCDTTMTCRSPGNTLPGQQWYHA
jgi:hypothetical protein